jgi:hypothetical protein
VNAFETVTLNCCHYDKGIMKISQAIYRENISCFKNTLPRALLLLPYNDIRYIVPYIYIGAEIIGLDL